ncbi:MAG: aldolase/citrate lyase family protein [Nitriliruptoraceae bacterium]
MPDTSPSRLRSVLESDTTAFGGWCAILDGFVAEIMGSAGFDWCCIDLQHGVGGHGAVVPMLQGLDATGTPTIVRVPWNEPSGIMRALDAGASGIIVPMVDAASQAAAAAKACRYAPAGSRSWGPARASLGRDDYTAERVNADVVCLPMVESVQAVAAVDEILAVEGIDGVFVGPSDLSVDMGIAPSRSSDDRLRTAVIEVLTACRRAGKIAGIFAPDESSLEAYTAAGFDMIAVHNDSRLLGQAARSALAVGRSHAAR